MCCGLSVSLSLSIADALANMSLLKRLASRTLLRSRGRFVGSVSACFAAGLKRQRRQLQPTIRFAAVAAATHCPQAGTMSPRCSMASNASCSQRSFATSSEAPGDAVEGETTVSSKTFHCVADATLDLFTEHLEVRWICKMLMRKRFCNGNLNVRLH